MSFYVSMFIFPILGAYDYFLPAQDVPEPLKPDLQAHVKPPFVLVQSALGWQLWVLAVHSFTSGVIRNVLKYRNEIRLNIKTYQKNYRTISNQRKMFRSH